MTISTSAIKLTDTQLVALSSASQRADRCVAPPEHLKGGATAKFISSLIAKGVAEEIEAIADMPTIRRDGEHGLALAITAAGYAALGIEMPAADALTTASGDTDPASKSDGNELPVEGGSTSGDSLIVDDAGSVPPAAASSSTARSATPRQGTKLAHVIVMLEREGAAISELMSATGWLAHTTRAAMTGLRKRGYTVELKGAEGLESRYRITAMPIFAKAA